MSKKQNNKEIDSKTTTVSNPKGMKKLEDNRKICPHCRQYPSLPTLNGITLCARCWDPESLFVEIERLQAKAEKPGINDNTREIKASGKTEQLSGFRKRQADLHTMNGISIRDITK